MERAKMIEHLEHLERYSHYSEDALALREVIEMLKDNGDCISRKAAIYIASGYCHPSNIAKELEKLPPAQPEQSEIGYKDCADAMLKMWIDEVLTDGEYNRIMDKLNAYWTERREEND